MKFDFSALVGNEPLKSILTHQLQSGTLSHAYLIVGEEGSGKTLLAKTICAAMACTSQSRPCGQCLFCQKIRDGLTPDILTIAPAPDKKQLTVDQIRSLREEAVMTANELPFKAFLIEKSEAMTTQAQNSLLKVLEEPPSNVYFFLMTDRPGTLLSTVRSRAQSLKTELFTQDKLSELLKERSPEAERMAKSEPEEYSALIRRAGGTIGRAEDLLNNRKKSSSPDPTAKEYLEKLSGNSHSDFQLYAASLSKDRERLKEILERILTAIRDLIAQKKAPNAPCLFYKDPQEAARLSACFTYQALLSLHLLFLQTLKELQSNVNLASAQLLLAEHAWTMKSR